MKNPSRRKQLTRVDHPESLIRHLRDQRVLLDRDLATLYGVEVRAVIQAVKRNRSRFPDDFVFQLNDTEAESLRSQTVILKKGRGRHRKYLPYVFTEQGVAMLSSVLRSSRAVQVNIGIMRAFVRLRQLTSLNQALGQKLAELEKQIGNHDEKIEAIFAALRELMSPPVKSVPKIGFKVGKK